MRSYRWSSGSVRSLQISPGLQVRCDWSHSSLRGLIGIRTALYNTLSLDSQRYAHPQGVKLRSISNSISPNFCLSLRPLAPNSSPTMQLNTLPVDGIRPILFYAHVDDLTRLFCTFDRRIMKAMSFPGALPYLRLKPATIGVPRAPLRYFVSCVRNVTHLSLVRVKWAPRSLSLLLALNPIRLDIDDEMLHESALTLLADVAKDPSNAELRSQALFLETTGLPNFSCLTTRLETLKFKNVVSTNVARLCRTKSLPPTITSLQGDMIYDMTSFPIGLRSLSLGNTTVALKEVFAACSRLESLELVGNDTVICERVAFPSTLTSLISRSRNGPAQLLGFECWTMRQSSISTIKLVPPIEVQRDPPRILDPLANLPATTTRLELVLYPPRNTTPTQPSLSAWPPMLRVLNLTLRLTNQPITALSELHVLEELTLKGPFHVSSEADPVIGSGTFFLDMLPPSLKIVDIDCYQFIPLSQFVSVTSKLSLLTCLVAHLFTLSELERFQKLAPRCRVYFESRSDTPSANMAFKFTESGLTHTPDLETFAKLSTAATTDKDSVIELSTRCGCVQNLQDGRVGITNRVFVTSEMIWMDLKSMTNHDSTLHMCSKPESLVWRSMKPEKVDMTVPHALTHMHLSTCVGRISLQLLPATLTNLTSTATVMVKGGAENAFAAGINQWPFTQLRHLDTPNWTFMASQLGNLRELEVFNAIIVALADYNVVDLLTTAVGPKTRRNMKIGIFYYVTGAMVPDGDVDGLQDVTWDSICASTIETLKRALAAPMPDVCPPNASVDDTAQLVHDMAITGPATVGSVLKSLAIPRGAISRLICLPSSATQINLKMERDSVLFPNWKLFKAQPNGLRPQFIRGDAKHLLHDRFGTGNVPIFPRSDILDRMTLSELYSSAVFQLPTSLRFLHLHLRPAHLRSLNHFPPKLEVLILEATGSEESFSVPLSSLPPTIRKIAWNFPFSGPATELQSSAEWLAAEFPCLSDVLLQCETAEVASNTWNLIQTKELPALRRFEVSLTTRQPEFGRQDFKVVSRLILTDLLQDTCEPTLDSRPILSASALASEPPLLVFATPTEENSNPVPMRRKVVRKPRA